MFVKNGGLLIIGGSPFSLPFTKDRGWPAVALPGVYIILQTNQSALLAEAKSNAYVDLCAKAFLSAVVEVSI